ncbi:putative avirulence induced gene (AIG) protein [Paramagnetospirillum caucaseum]|uniref:Putative gamma-glutamylcyclotransferase n=2 Tax=Paramagnetospirillum caucaseum TaxID=1244869 RepID=M3A662_9PROT|nr:putative avirulence induced gene (AIG) protein [Paramagnetospirillum caucaseum]
MFFFGTLMDGDVLAAVLGRRLAPDSMEPARLAGWRRVAIAGRTYPMLTPHPTGGVDGLLAHGLDGNDRRRLDHYEGAEYRAGMLTVRRADGSETAAETYLCRPEVAAGREEWRLETWRRRHKRAALARIRALMAGWRN